MHKYMSGQSDELVLTATLSVIHLLAFLWTDIAQF